MEIFLVFTGPFIDKIDKKMGDLRGIFGTSLEALECAKKNLPRNNDQKAQIHKCTLGCYPQGLNGRTIYALVWWNSEKNDWQINIPSQTQINGYRRR